MDSHTRLDKAVFSLNLARSRAAAAALITNGSVTVNGLIADKPSMIVGDDDKIAVTEQPRFVGRGGLKLEHALNAFDIDLSGAVCLDVGASTGGFTDCMLQKGAMLIYAVDVGSDQLDARLKGDKRVVSIERLDIRKADNTLIPAAIGFAAIDVSFISLKLVLPELKRFLKPQGKAVVLIKPQFETGKRHKGVVADVKLRERIKADITAFAETLGFAVGGVCESPIKGGSGNAEYLMYLHWTSAKGDAFI